jgi:hypothetical protein
MCTYVTTTADITRGSAYDGSDWFSVDRAVVYFDHPQDVALDHALCIDVWGSAGRRVAVELDADSARRLAESILEVLGSCEVQDVLEPLAVAHQGNV